MPFHSSHLLFVAEVLVGECLVRASVKLIGLIIFLIRNLKALQKIGCCYNAREIIHVYICT